MNNAAMDMDPLSYQAQYGYQPTVAPLQPNIPSPYKDYYPHVPYNVPANVPTNVPSIQAAVATETQPVNQVPKPISHVPNDQPVTNNVTNVPNTAVPEEEDVKPDITQLKPKRDRKLRGKRSSYWNKKISDKNFKFYGCAICNISFQELTELDSHVTVHRNRITSYDLRKQNLEKRKQLKKMKREKKKKKKESKIKDEFEVDIKPEDGYIGTERAEDFNENSDANRIAQADNKSSEINKPNEHLSKDEKNSSEKENNKKNEVYKCFACNKLFALSYYLKIHVRSHTDEKPYICNYCGQMFITASKLNRHNKRIHLSIKHQCRICYKYYSRFELLTKHFDKKHEDQKLEGEVYDYNLIIPYLAELEEQLKLESLEQKPKTEDLWEGELPLDPGGPKLEGTTKVEKVEKMDTLVFSLKQIDVEHKEQIDGLSIDIKQEFDDPACDGRPVGDGSPRPEVSDEEKGLKEEEDHLTDDDEYFPPDTWARPPSEDEAPLPADPSPKKEGMGVCDLCNKSFSSKSYLKIHLRTHTGEKPFSCYICGRSFITASKMHRHVLTHDESWTGENAIKPDGVEVKTENEGENIDSEKKVKSKSNIDKAKAKLLKKPKKKVGPKTSKEKSKRPHTCEYCDKKFRHIETLQVHEKSHEGEELVLKCCYCLEPQLDRETKAEHEATHTGPKRYLCTICERQYKDKGAMICHRKNHKPNSEKLCCDICTKRFNTQAALQRHIVSHTSEKFVLRYECPVCANMFHTRWHVQMHLKSHQKEGLILEENRNAVLAMVLQNARKIPRSPGAGQSLNQIQGPGQNQSFKQNQALGLTHNEERSRICNICGEVFHHFYYLEEHLKSHGSKIAVEDLDKEEEKKHTCQVCSKSFKLHYYLKLHSYTHTKEKPFICQQCGKGFITRGKLKRHLETHQGLKKYQCHICYKFFTRPSYLRIHVRTIHGTQDYNFMDYGLGAPLGRGSDSGV